jgi:hypothetical protein
LFVAFVIDAVREVIKEDENITAFWALHPDQLTDEKIVRGKFRRAA